MTEERKAKRRRVESADEVVETALSLAVKQITQRLDQVHMERMGQVPAIQKMIAKDTWTKVLPFLCMSDAVSAFQGGYLYVPRPWQMQLTDTLEMDGAFIKKHQDHMPELVEFWRQSKLGVNVRTWNVHGRLTYDENKYIAWISCFPRLEAVTMGFLHAGAVAHLIRQTKGTLRKLAFSGPWFEGQRRWVEAFAEAKPRLTELRLTHGTMNNDVAEVLPSTLTTLEMTQPRLVAAGQNERDNYVALLNRCPVLVDLSIVVVNHMRRMHNVLAAAKPRSWVKVILSPRLGIVDADLAAIGGPSLRYLSFTMDECTMPALSKLLEASTGLEFLEIYSLETVELIRATVAKHPPVKTLRIVEGM